MLLMPNNRYKEILNCTTDFQNIFKNNRKTPKQNRLMGSNWKTTKKKKKIKASESCLKIN